MSLEDFDALVQLLGEVVIKVAMSCLRCDEDFYPQIMVAIEIRVIDGWWW
jgi:uncharacterized metal-binding protein YceD (DUF177 family)